MHDERTAEPHKLEYAPPLPRPRRRFLARPFWRDYVLAYVCIGFGAVLYDCAAPAHGSERAALLTFATIVGIPGIFIFVCAIGCSFSFVMRRPRNWE
jgi:hypothetical protein